MKNWKKLSVATLLAVSAFAITAQAGTWSHDGVGYTYLFDSNAYARDQVAEIDGVKYGFDSAAHMLTDWQQIGGDWYYFDPYTGVMQTGWVYLDNDWYYFDPATGVMQTGWLISAASPNRYYFDPSGKLQHSGFFDAADGLSYYADENGVVLRNATLENTSGVIYVFDEFGHYRIINDETRAGGGNMFSQEFVPDDTQFNDFLNTISDEADERRHDKMDDFYDKYEEYDAGSGITNTQKNRWENNVHIQLGQLNVSDADIEEFIYEVERGYYTPYYDRADD